MDAQTIEKQLCCSACGVERGCACEAPAVYLSVSEQRELRRKRAAELYKSGLSMQQIADQLKVAVNTISEDLAGLIIPETGRIKQPKTAKNPKGAGRPKGSKSKRPRVKQDAARRRVGPTVEAGEAVSRKKLAGELGVSEKTIERAEQYEQGRLEGLEDAVGLAAEKVLSMSAREKFEAALRQQQRALNAQFEKRVAAEYTARVQKGFPELEKMEREARDNKRLYERLLRESKKLGTQADWNNLVLCLHPDTRRTASDEKFDRAFAWVQSRKFAITGEEK